METALPVILSCFWDSGYAGQTLDQIASEVGATKPTLVRTFGDKDAIFTAALVHYHQTYIAPAEEHLEKAGTLRDGLRGFFAVFVDRIANQDLPRGCFMGDTAAISGLAIGAASNTLQQLQEGLASKAHERIEAATVDGELEPTTSPVPVLQFILGQVSALSAISRSNPTRTQLETVVEYAIAGLPWTDRFDNVTTHHA